MKKKIILTLISCAFLTSCVSCTSKVEKPADDQNISQEVRTLSLKSASIGMAEEFAELISVEGKNPNVMMFGQRSDGSFGGCFTTKSFAEKKSFDFTPAEGEDIRAAAMIKYGKTAVLTVCNGNTMLYVVDIEGSIENTFDLGKLIDESDVFVQLAADESGFYINISRTTLAFVTAEGVYSGNIGVSGRTITGIACDSSGCPTALLSDDDDLVMAKLSGGEITEESWCGASDSAVYAVGAGRGEYRLTAIISGILYGIKDGGMTKINDFSDFIFNPQTISAVFMTDDSEFVVKLYNTSDDTMEVLLLTERDISEIKERKIIRLAVMRDEGNLSDERIKKFNSERDDVKIEEVFYGLPSNDLSVTDTLRADLLTGNAPDIISFTSDLPLGTFGARDSLFVDLYDLMANDSDVSPTDFADGFLDGLEINGKLLQFTGSFSIDTLIMKKKWANGMTSWNFEQFEELWKSMPEDMELSTEAKFSYRSMVFRDFVNYSAFVDYDSATCRFDSPEFIRAMKFISDNNIGMTAEQFNSSDKSCSADEMMNLLHNDKVLLNHSIGLWNFYQFKTNEQLYFNEPVICIGYPSDTGSGIYMNYSDTYGIMASSPNIDEAWEFLKYYTLSDDGDRHASFSGLESRLKEQLEEEKKLHTGLNADGEEVNIDGQYYFDTVSGEPIRVEFLPFTDEQAAEYERVVREALRNPYYSDSQIWKILWEELNSYFEGERSAEDTASIIQNRASIYLSEKYS